MSLLQSLFGQPKKSPAEQAKEWKATLTSEARKLDRQITKIRREELKAKQAIKAAAKQNNLPAAKILAREMLRTRKAVKRMHLAKTQLNSVLMQIQLQLSQMKVAGALQQSTEVMRTMNSLCRVTEISAMMQSMSREMTKAGLIDEMVGDTLDSALDDDLSEGETDEEVAKVVQDVLQSQMEGTRVGSGALPQTSHEEEVEPEVEEDDEDLAKRLNALKMKT